MVEPKQSRLNDSQPSDTGQPRYRASKDSNMRSKPSQTSMNVLVGFVILVLAVCFLFFIIFPVMGSMMQRFQSQIDAKLEQNSGQTGPMGPAGQTGPATLTGSSQGILSFNSNNTNIVDTNIINNGWVVNVSEEFSAGYNIPLPITLRSFRVVISGIPGFGNTRVFTVRKNGVNTSMTVSMTGLQVDNSISNQSISFASGDQLSLQTTSIGTPGAATCEASVSYSPV